MTSTAFWLPGAHRVDLSADHGYGPFHVGGFMGVVLHVNVAEHGTSDDFFRHNAASVCPNFEVYKSEAEGGIHQYLPLNWRPWCQVDGNQKWAAIETAGMPNEPLTGFQIQAIARILAAYHNRHAMPLQVTDSVNTAGFGTHSMGGPAWGGHSCPGTIRAGQRPAILAAAKAMIAAPAPTPPALGLNTTDQAWIDHRIAAKLKEAKVLA